MIQYMIRRLFGAVVVIFAVSLITFLIFQLAPRCRGTSPVYYYVGQESPAQAVPVQAAEHRSASTCRWSSSTGTASRASSPVRTSSDGTSGPLHCAAPCLGYSFRLNTSVSR